LGISSCPNDTFIFAALLSGKTNADIDFDLTMDDVERLNGLAIGKKLDIVKISYGVVNEIIDEYALLPAGGALGFGCGPLLVKKPDTPLKGKIAVPGLRTTAFKLFSMFYPEHIPDCTPVRFDRIMPEVKSGEYAAGLIIHEGRFTYQNYGLDKVADMGELWQERFKTPLPLGAIAMKRSLAAYAHTMNTLITASLNYAYKDTQGIMPFVKKYSDEMDEDVMKSHIELYVNRYSIDARPALKGISEFLNLPEERIFHKV
jgi:1,4-dihydroxy-6-naphthoate synthase